MTLLELLVTMTILAIVTSIASLSARPAHETRDPLRAMIDDSLEAAIAQGRRITIELERDGRTVAATVGPDGSVIADSARNTAIRRGSSNAR
ncbi:MAG TPA: prepilin-type N-terminal cleavage/methylation domain-containing protein [Gemmatimonadaceae bacterium]|jgi:prepilin-type N-terminal cleavage/methylation domain-containing protein